MELIVCVASADSNRLEGFIENIYPSFSKLTTRPKLLLIENFEPTKPWRLDEKADVYWKAGNPERRPYSKIMRDKVEFVTEYADDNSVVLMLDDDYAFNPWALKAAQVLFEENSEVNYASFVRGSGATEGDIVLSGWKFVRWGSCMGGSVIARWSVFKEHAAHYFSVCLKDSGFDSPLGVGFWPFLKRHYGLEKVVYTMTWPFSLMQHCYFGSLYGHDKHGHAFSVNFDGRSDPFNFKAM